MTLSQRHITAGDLTPVTINSESTYGTPDGATAYYGDVAEGGRFTFTDTANPYLAWRYGSRSFDPSDYVTRQKDAGFIASLEVRDTAGWGQIITNAVGTGGTTSGDPLLPSRTESIYVKMASNWKGRTYNGCKTDSLTIKADAPGGIVTFEETVLASKSSSATKNSADSVWTSINASAVQWMNGITIGANEIYPQSFELRISNNLERIRIPSSGTAITGSLLEGRRSIELQADIWMEDLAYINTDMQNGTPGNAVIMLGIDNPVTITLTGVRWMADGTHPDLIQDKQRQTLRLRAANISVA
jgi:hypothetical protein